MKDKKTTTAEKKVVKPEKTGKEIREENLIPFKKGESGNPEGKKPGTRNFSTIYKEALKKLAMKNGMEPDQLEEDILVKALQSSYNGNFKFFKDIHDRLHGQPVKSIDHTTGGDKIRTNTITFVNYDGEPESK